MLPEVVILFGGTSSERLVSVASAQNVADALPRAEPWFLSPTGAVHAVPRTELLAHQRPFEVELEPAAAPLYPTLEVGLDQTAHRDRVFLLALHGGEGENGTLQRLFEARRMAFTASGSLASARAFDKQVARELVAAKGVRVARAQVLDASASEQDVTALFGTAPRWVLKPVADGSSHGLLHLTGAADVPRALELLSTLKLRYLAEEFIAGRELTVGVVDGDDGPFALPVSEVKLDAGAAFDYQGKYLGRGTQEITPADLTAAERDASQALAVAAHRALGCYGYTRTDLILTASGPTFLETNTLPGLTKASFIPQQLAAAGRDFKAFLEAQLDLARRRAATS